MSLVGQLRRPRIVTPASGLPQQAVHPPFELLRNVLHQKSSTSKLALKSKPDDSNAAHSDRFMSTVKGEAAVTQN
jgi:hypothetical protein